MLYYETFQNCIFCNLSMMTNSNNLSFIVLNCIPLYSTTIIVLQFIHVFINSKFSSFCEVLQLLLLMLNRNVIEF